MTEKENYYIPQSSNKAVARKTKGCIACYPPKEDHFYKSQYSNRLCRSHQKSWVVTLCAECNKHRLSPVKATCYLCSLKPGNKKRGTGGSKDPRWYVREVCGFETYE